jgi:hypothetical protein
MEHTLNPKGGSMQPSESQSGQPLDRLIAVGVAFLLAAFAFTALGPSVAGASQSDEAVGKRYDDADDVVTVDDDDDADPDELRDGNSGTTKGTGKSHSKSNTNDNSAGSNDNSRGSGNGGGGGGGGGTGTGNSGGT